MSKLSILFVVPLPPPYAGVEQMSQFIIESPLSKHFNLMLIKSNIRDANAKKGHWDLQGMVKVLWIGLKLFFKNLFSRPDLVYMTLSQNGTGLLRDLFYVALCLISRRRFVLHLHGAQLHIYIASKSKNFRKIVSYFLNKAESVIVLAEKIKKDLSSSIAPERLQVVYNGLPESQFVSGKDKRHEEVVISFMGHMSQGKGFYDIVLSMEEVLTKSENIYFQFAGERLDNEKNIKNDLLESPQKIWETVNFLQKKFPSRIRFHGCIYGDAKELFLRTSDILLLPSYSEAFPMVILEAAAKGNALITTKVGALEEVLIFGKNCLFVEAGNPKELKNAIFKLSEDEDLIENMKGENIEWSTKFNILKTADQLKNLFEKILHMKEKIGINES